MQNAFLTTKIPTILFFLFVVTVLVSGCKSLQLGGGVSYNSGNSGGCADESDVGIQLESEYYFGKNSGPGIAVELFTPGYTDCNDGDPLLFLIPKLKYRYLIKNKNWAFDFGTGYAMGAFVDPGYHLSTGITYYSGSMVYFKLEQNMYRAFKSKENAIMPGTSSNLSSQIGIGIYFD